MKMTQNAFLSFCLCTFFLLSNHSLSGQLTGSSNAALDEPCGTNMFLTTSQTTQVQTGENPSDYLCNFSGSWPSCEPVTIPVYGIVAKTDNGLGPVTEQMFFAAIGTLNSAFASTGFKFEPIGVEEVWDDDLYDLDILDILGLHYQYKKPKALTLYINHEITISDGIYIYSRAGAALPPWSNNFAVFVDHDEVYSPTVAHELGHALGLFHTFETRFAEELVYRGPTNPLESSSCSNCKYAGDLLCDTPADDNGGNEILCNDLGVRRDDCQERYLAPITNLMSYYLDCRNTFSPQQIERMKCIYEEYYKQNLGFDEAEEDGYSYDFEYDLGIYSSDYNTTSGVNFGASTVEIGTNPNSLHTGFVSCGDHSTGTTKMLVVNGSTDPSKRVLYGNLVVDPFTWYEFSIWATPVYEQNRSKIMLKTGGKEMMNNPILLNLPLGTWRKVSGKWFTGPNCILPVEIHTTETAASGNDFAIDDISLRRTLPNSIWSSSKNSSFVTETSQNQIKLFPNPAQNQVSLKLDLHSETSISYSILDLQGKVVYQHPAHELPEGRHALRWDRPAGISAGVYLVKINLGEQVQTQRLVLR